MSKSRCFECGNNSGNWVFRKSVREYEGEGYSFELEVETPYCEQCGSPIYDKEIEQRIRDKANERIREQTGIISKKEILELVDLYGVSQKYLSKVLGWGEITLPRYISGSYSPCVENSEKLKSIRNPYLLMNMLEENIEDHGDPLWIKLFKNANQLIFTRETQKGKIFAAVDWFLTNISEEEGITHLALQKALYFVQAWNYIFNGKWMFSEDCEAWIHGAVYRSVFDEFKAFKYNKLPKLKCATSLQNEEIKTLEFVKENYLDVYSAKTLEKICHMEDPFKNARGMLDENDRSESEITKESIAMYYEKIAEEYAISDESRESVQSYISNLLFAHHTESR